MSLLPGDESVSTSFNSTTSGVGGGLTGLGVESGTLGEVDSLGGSKVVHMALDLPKIKGVRVCYESTSGQSFISQIRLAQVQNPPSSALVVLDDGTDLTDTGRAHRFGGSKQSAKHRFPERLPQTQPG